MKETKAEKRAFAREYLRSVIVYKIFRMNKRKLFDVMSFYFDCSRMSIAAALLDRVMNDRHEMERFFDEFPSTRREKAQIAENKLEYALNFFTNSKNKTKTKPKDTKSKR